jgi:hypothetical protein
MTPLLDRLCADRTTDWFKGTSLAESNDPESNLINYWWNNAGPSLAQRVHVDNNFQRAVES